MFYTQNLRVNSKLAVRSQEKNLANLMNQSLLAINMALPHGVYEDVVSAIGHTPLIRLNKVTANLSGSEVWAKLERCSPGGSIKDRIGLAMILEAEEKGWLKPG
jgi:threonine dehydratase